MVHKIVNGIIVLSVIFLLNGCGDNGVRRNSDFKGKIYFKSNRFGGETYLDNTGTCYYDGRNVHKLYKDKWFPKISRNGEKLISCDLINRRMENGKFSIVDLLSKKNTNYVIPLVILRFEWMPDNKRIGVVGYDEKDGKKNKLFNVYIFDSETSGLMKITNNTLPKVFIHSFSFSPDGKKVVYGIRRTQDPKDGQIVKILDIETGQEEEIPFSSGHVAWSPDGKTIAMAGTYYEPDGEMSAGSKLMFYNLEDGSYKVLPKDEGNGQYQWESKLCYSPDGEKLAFLRTEISGAKTLWMMDSDGTNREKLVYDGYQIGDLSWSEK